jgi:hypothetical protein
VLNRWRTGESHCHGMMSHKCHTHGACTGEPSVNELVKVDQRQPVSCNKRYCTTSVVGDQVEEGTESSVLSDQIS